MISPEKDHFYNIILSIFFGIILVIIFNSLFDSPRSVIIYKN